MSSSSQSDYDYELVDDTYCEWINHLKPEVELNSPKMVEVKKDHPLMLMIQHNREELLDHRLVRQLLKNKWNSCGYVIFYGTLLLYMLFLIPFTVYVATARPPFFLHKNDEADFCSNARDEQSIVNIGFSKKATRELSAVILTFLALNVIKEVNF